MNNNKIIIGIIVIALVVGIVFIVSSNKGYTPSSPTLTTTPQATIEPTSQATVSSQIIQEQNTITLDSSGFSPNSLTVKAGDKVTWVNKSGADASVNSSPHPTHTDYLPLNLDAFPDNGTLSLTFDKSGTYKYHNHLNPSQFGTIVVE
ncbi:cupredoxin domain-containing protein [Candidatus Daviesbacteria bacterium]|nr:cupredoxin domain-containing protein [Candidatus Daviesbacteria bacterium]